MESTPNGNRLADMRSAGAPGRRPSLVRAIGRWSLTAAVINGVIGSSLFGMPSAVAALAGTLAPVAVLFAGACIFVVVLCFAEVGSRFDQPGGPYLYTREAFGPATGFHVGWLHIWARLLSGAANLNVLVAYLALLLPAVGTRGGRAATMVLAMGIVTSLNVRGVRQATWTVNLFTLGKLVPPALLIIFGASRFDAQVFLGQGISAPRFTDAVLLLVFGYGGFESSIIAASETVDPRRDTARALISGMAVVAIVYCLVHLIIMGLLPTTAADPAPFASALRVLWGTGGSWIGAIGALLSVSGWLAGFALMTPRILFSMADRGELPSALGHVHPRFRTPDAAVITNSAVALALALPSGFADAAALAAIARLGIFLLTCASLVALRRRSGPAPFRLPAGPAFAVAGVTFCVWLLTTRSLTQGWLLVGTIAAGELFRRTARGGRT